MVCTMRLMVTNRWVMHSFKRGVWMVGCVAGLMPALPAHAWLGLVTHVSDGDTVWVKPLQGKQTVKVRLRGIDAPEICQPYGVQAQAVLQAMVLGQWVDVEMAGSSVDNYGRVVATLTRQGQDVGAWMVASGNAWSYSFRHHATPYDELQARAQSQRMGLFADPQAMPPRVFRKRVGMCPSPASPGPQ